MNLRIKPNDETGFWEIHDESGFLCKLGSESTAALIVHTVNALPELTTALEMAEHQSPVRDLSCVQDLTAGSLLISEWRPHAPRGRRIAQPAPPGAIDLAAIALEAERVIPIGAHFPTIPESGLSLLARGARALDARGATTTFAAQHGDLQTDSGSWLLDTRRIAWKADRPGHTLDVRSEASCQRWATTRMCGRWRWPCAEAIMAVWS